MVAFLFIGRILFLDLGGVQKDDREKVRACRGGEDAVAKSITDELGQKSGMVEMDVAEENEVDRLGRDGKRGPVPLEEISLLEKTAVDEQPEAVRFDEKRRSRDLLCGA